MKIRELAYVAGLFDGEGNVQVFQAFNRPRGSFAVSATITNTSLTTLKWVRSKFGGSIILHSTSVVQGKKPCYYLRWFSSNAVKFLKSIYPYCKIKRRDILPVLNFKFGHCGVRLEKQEQLKRENAVRIHRRIRQLT